MGGGGGEATKILQFLQYSKVPSLRNSVLRNSGLIFYNNILCYKKLDRLFSVEFLMCCK